jgi:hypothetical protein
VEWTPQKFPVHMRLQFDVAIVESALSPLDNASSFLHEGLQ